MPAETPIDLENSIVGLLSSTMNIINESTTIPKLAYY